MAGGVHITSLEALEAFRASLIVYLNAVRPALDEVRGEFVRARLWLESDRQSHWENQIRRRAQRVQDAEAELFKIRLSDLSTGAEVARAAARKAREALREAEDKLKRVRRWAREFDQVIGPTAKVIDRLRDALATDLAEAVSDLSRTVEILAGYAGTGGPPKPSPPSACAGGEGAGEDKP